MIHINRVPPDYGFLVVNHIKVGWQCPASMII